MCKAYEALNLSLPLSALPKLDRANKKIALTAIVKAYQVEPSKELLYLAAIVLQRPLCVLCESFGVALPSEILYRLEQGLDRGSRYLMRWVKRWLVRRLKRQQLYQETEALFALVSDATTQQTPSDPGLRRAILAALSQLGPRDREIVGLLARGNGPTDIALKRRTSNVAARQHVTRARDAFAAALKNYYSRPLK